VDSIRFGELLKKYRHQAVDTMTKGGYLSENRLADLVKEQTRLEITGTQIEIWETGRDPFPPQDAWELLHGIVEVLKNTGGLQTRDEINELIVAAGYDPILLDEAEKTSAASQAYPGLINQSMINAFYLAAGPDNYLDWITRARLRSMEIPDENRCRPYAGPKVEELSGLSSEEQSALESHLTRFTDPRRNPPPVTPEDEAEITRRGTTIRVSKVAKAWLLPVDALALVAAGSLDKMGGEFFANLIDDFDSRKEKTGYELDSFLNREFPSDLRNDNPAYRHLPVDLGIQVLPYAREGRSGVFIVTRRASKDDSITNFEESLATMLRALVTLAGENEVQSLAIPLIGSGGGKMPPTTVASLMLNALVGISNFNSLKTIVIVTIDDAVVPACRKQINVLEYNRAQDVLNDEPTGRDLLGIEEEVHAMAEALVLRDASPPLAVGILGGWGTGKSFVMHLMQQKMTEIRTRKIKKGWPENEDDPNVNIFAGHIYQIRFNAWTYAKSNLWASLMQTIFFELNRQLSLEQSLQVSYPPLDGHPIYQLLYEPQMRIDGEYLKQDRRTNVNSLWEIMRALKQKQLADLRETETQIKAEETKRDKARAARVLELKLRGQTSAMFSSALQQILQTQGEVSPEQLEELKNNLLSVRSTAQRLREIYLKNRRKFLGLLVLIIVLLAGSFYLSKALDLSTTIQRYAPLVITVLGILMRLMPDVLRWNSQVNQIVDTYENLTAEELEEWDTVWKKELEKNRLKEEQKVVEETDEISLSKEQKVQRLKELGDQGNLAAMDRYLEYLQGQADEQRRLLGPTANYVSLVDFVQARLNEQSYEDKLGLMHQVKQDIDELTEGFVIQEWDDPDVREKKMQLFPRGKARVVLYIDDLDRCQPERVVEVMEAVQLLLNTRLFVVVLGLDTRYVTRALEKEYKEILEHEGDPSGLDYIEKIIQIPYRVRPIEREGLSNYLDQQMEVDLSRNGNGSSGSESETGQSTQELDSSSGAGDTDYESLSPNTGDGGQEPDQTRVGIRDHPEDLPLEVIRFQLCDKSDLSICCNQIQLTPRSVKRLVNVFKLVKIFWFRKYGADKPRQVKQTMLALFALSAGYPEIMRDLFVELDTLYRDPVEIKKPLLEIMEAYIKEVQSANPWQVSRFEKDFKALQQVNIKEQPEPLRFFEITLEKLEQPTFNLVRSFSFVGDPTFAVTANFDNPPPFDPDGGVPSP